jgi:hypothetical protein
VSTANIAAAADFKKYRRPPRLGAKGTGQFVFMALLLENRGGDPTRFARA